MNPLLRVVVVSVGVLVLATVSVRGNYLTNADVEDNLEGWSGDGERVLLKPDGTEGSEGVPVIKLTLSHGQSHNAYQEIAVADNAKGLLFRVEVYPSADFQRSKFEVDYNDHETVIISSREIMVPMTDFWIRLGLFFKNNDPMPEYRYKTTDLKPGQWTTVTSETIVTDKLGDHFTVNFCVPPGSGAIYLKNPSVEAKSK